MLRVRKIEEYHKNAISLTQTDLRAIALVERRRNPELEVIFSQVVQNVADRVHTAFMNFFAGRARFPRSKPTRKFTSLTFPQFGFKLNPQRGIYLSGIGNVRAFIHRPIVGKIKRLTVKHEAGEWYAIFVADRESPTKLPLESVPTDRIRGADLGLEKFVTFDNGTSTEYPEFMRKSEGRIKAVHRRLVHKVCGSKRWRKACFSLARLHMHVRRQRDDFQNKLVNSLFSENDVLVLEKLRVSAMPQNHNLAKSISDASWGKFAKKAISKSEMLGKHLVFVDPWGTTQFCYSCLAWVPKDLSERAHKCHNCGVDISRDLNSSRLIKRLGILSSPPSDGGSSLAEPGPLPSLRGMVSRGFEAGSHLF
jgi:putative transposase